MKTVSLRNPRLINTLQSLIDYVFLESTLANLRENISEIKCRNIPGVPVVSEEYLRKALTLDKRQFGFPSGSRLVELKNIKDAKVHKEVCDRIYNVSNVLGTGYNALCAFYPAGGNIGWHHNGNAPGHNIIFTYNTTNRGAFYHYDKESDKIITLQDQEGWNVKAGYYGHDGTHGRDSTDRIFWHAADTETERFTIAWVLNHKPMWENMIEDIESD